MGAPARMELGLVITGGLAFLGLWGSLWYKLGKLTAEVKHHNMMLAEMSMAIEKILTRGG